MEVPAGHEANLGDVIQFNLNGFEVKGKVVPSSCQRCVMVDISGHSQNIGFEHNRTVVGPGNYKVINKR
ncbi:DUF2187 family protein [Thalassobacillus pellis]|uniref:DUF2187 family protein n=1 Tax=Thalassobacillus pellis TaxID=748008 RepID=UPI0019620EA9|nr:DUF2187 family protein [Thalassobacillus pellis]MBM7551882.1 hypothetical protein [Thalassobacillus pellis]